MIIYKVTNLENGKIYIGQSINSLEHRKSQHERDCRRNKYYNNLFHNALIKWGFNNFEWEVIDECETLDELNALEIKYVAMYDTLNREKGYNLKAGGKNGGTCCAETKVKIGQTTKEKWENPEIAKKMRDGLAKATEVWKQKAANYFDERTCPVCGKVFKCKPYKKKKYCTLECANRDPNCYTKGITNARKAVMDRYNASIPEKIELIYEWVKNNKSILENVKMNKLTFLNDLCDFLNIKDQRTVAKIFGLKGRKELVLKLIEISKNIC